MNLKAELEIMGMHEKLDQIRAWQMEYLVIQQQVQPGILTRTFERLEQRGRKNFRWAKNLQKTA